MVRELQDLSRRGFLALGGAAAALLSPLRRIASPARSASAPHPGKPEPTIDRRLPADEYATHQYSLTGGWATDGFLVKSQLLRPDDVGKQVDLVVTDPSDPGSPYTFSAFVDSDAIATHYASGLPEQADFRQYDCQLAEPGGDPFGHPFKGCTRISDDAGDYSLTIILGSCLANPPEIGTSLALADAGSQQAPVLFHLGDWGYWGQSISGQASYRIDLKKYIQANTAIPELLSLIHSSNLEAVCISDHELHNDGDHWRNDASIADSHEDTFGCPHSKRQITAHRTLFPVRTWGDQGDLPVHRGYFSDFAPHVRLVVSDLRSPERHMASDPDGDPGDYKELWGQTQEQWLFDEAFDVPPDTAVLFVNETSWWRRGDQPTTDKPASYPDAQDKFVAKLNEIPPQGGTPLIERFVWLGGDRHYAGYLSRADAQQPYHDGFPQFIGSGFYKNSLTVALHEDMTWRTATRGTGDPIFSVCQYVILTLDYHADGSGSLDINGRARAAVPTHYLYEGVGQVTKGSTIVTSTQDVFTPDTLNGSIGGSAIPIRTTITEIQSPTVAVISNPATADATGMALAVGIDPALWQLVDFPNSDGDTETITF